MRPSSSPYANPSGIVDKRIGNMFSEIEQVRAALPQISHLSYYLESIFNLQRNLDLLSQQGVSHHILKDITVFQGANAYEIALANDFVGTETEWLDSLVGPQGPMGLLDEVAHQELIDGIAANLASITAVNLTVTGHTTAIADRLTVTAFNLYAAGIQDQLTQLEEDILAAVPGLVPPIDEDAVTSLAQLVFDNAIVAISSSVSDVNTRVDAADVLLDALREDVDAGETAFNEFLFENATTLGRITSLEAAGVDTNASIINLQTVTSETATQQEILAAESATHFASIASIETVQADQATQINVLQVANNANSASITSLETVVVDGFAAAASDRLDIRADFAAADSSVSSYAAALVSSEATARSTADAAAAADRLDIRADFAAADAGVASTAAALVASEASTRATAISAAAADRTLIRSEFATADAGVLSSATALVNSEASTRASADGALSSSITTVSATLNGVSATVIGHTSAISGINGVLNAAYTLTLDVGGRISGFKSVNDGSVSEFEILADIFKIIDPSGGARTEYSDGNWRVYDASNVLRVQLGVWT